MRGTSSSAFILLGAAAIVACSQLTAASSNDTEEYDSSPASPFDLFMSERGNGGDKCMRDKLCFKKGGKCVAAGTCDTVEIRKMCHKKNGDACTCCAKDKTGKCKRSKECRKAGGFCVVKKQACKNGKLLKKDCRCKGVRGMGRRGYCCVAPEPTTPEPTTQGPTTQGPTTQWTTEPGRLPEMITIGSEQFKVFFTYGSWAAANTMCSDEGMIMAEPQDPPTVVGYLKDNYGYFWLGASGNGVNFVWNSGGILSSNSSYWFGDHPSGRLNNCLVSNSFDDPYYAYTCNTNFYFLCQ